MAHSEYDKEMKALELFSQLRVPDGAYPILRIDGRGFSGFTQRLGLQKPYDTSFDRAMGYTTERLMENLGAIYGYHQSDEISLLLPRDTIVFDRRYEKLISVSAGLASSAFTSHLGAHHPELEEEPHFDARLIVACTQNQVWRYFNWRQQDATRNCLNSWCHWTAILTDEMSPTAAGKLFEEKDVEFKNEFLFKHGINFNDRPVWEKRGTGRRFVAFKKEGFNPVTKQKTLVDRRRIEAIPELPHGFGYHELIVDILAKADEP